MQRKQYILERTIRRTATSAAASVVDAGPYARRAWTAWDRSKRFLGQFHVSSDTILMDAARDAVDSMMVPFDDDHIRLTNQGGSRLMGSNTLTDPSLKEYRLGPAHPDDDDFATCCNSLVVGMD